METQTGIDYATEASSRTANFDFGFWSDAVDFQRFGCYKLRVFVEWRWLASSEISVELATTLPELQHGRPLMKAPSCLNSSPEGIHESGLSNDH